MKKKLFFYLAIIAKFGYIFSRCMVEYPKNRSACFNITLEESERQTNSEGYTPDACCYAWTNYYTVFNINGRTYRLTNNCSYCGKFEKARIKEYIKKTKDKYINYTEMVDFDMFIDCGDNEEQKDGEKKEKEYNDEKEYDEEEYNEEEENKDDHKESNSKEKEKEKNSKNEENNSKNEEQSGQSDNYIENNNFRFILIIVIIVGVICGILIGFLIYRKIKRKNQQNEINIESSFNGETMKENFVK